MFFNQNDAQRPEIVSKCRFEIQYGDYWFLNNSGKRPNNTHYGYFRDCYDALKPQIDILSCKMATFGDWKTAENDPKTTKYGCFFNQNDAQRPEIVTKCHFEIQDGDLWFLENSRKWPNTTQYECFFNQNDTQRPGIVSKYNFEIQDGDFRSLKNSQKWPISIQYEMLRYQNDTQEQKSSTDTILNSKMVTSGFWKTAEND